MHKIFFTPISFICLVFSFFACNTKKSADMIVHHALVYTVDSAFSTAEAFAVKDGKFIAIGSSEAILSTYEASKVIDAGGAPVYPGFYDAHAHFFDLAGTLSEADLTGTQSFEEIIERLQAFRKANPDFVWLKGNGWDQNDWENKRFPDRKDLDAVFPDVPVYLTRVDGHAAIANTKALELAGITKAQKVEGGLMVTENGRLTGVLVDNAQGLVRRHIPEPSREDMETRLLMAQDSCLSVGLTTLADAGLGIQEIDLLQKMYADSTLKIRDYAMVAYSKKNAEEFLKRGTYTSDKLNVRSFKLMSDGALGSRGACMLEPYSDANTHGFLLLSPDALDTAVATLAKSNFQANTHAIGDSANRIMLDLYGKYLKGKNDRRWRIEHAQIIAPEDFKKFAAYDIIPSVQPTHATSDMYWAGDRIGAERLKGAYAYQDLLDTNGKLALGSDFPVEHFNPLYGFHAAVARVDAQGYPEGGFQMENAISREDALRGMTIWAAYACFEENTHGSIEAGKAADFVVLEADIMQVPDEALRDVKVSKTVVGGELVYAR